jgi:hypothetical protein
MDTNIIFIVLKPGPTRRVDPRLKRGQVEEKIRKEKTWCDLATWQDSVKNLIATR